MSDSETFDYIVIGAGSAGAPLASRLSESGRHSVLVLEAGPARAAPWTTIPMGYVFFLGKSTPNNWNFNSAPEPFCNNRVINMPRGRGLGGTSLINSMMYVRGAPFDYDRWRDMGNTGWGYADVLPFFKRAEKHALGETDYHGADGPLNVRPHQSSSPLHEAMVRAGAELGYPVTDDFNGEAYEGFGRYHHNQFLKNGMRCSTAAAYLATARTRGNLEIRANAHVEKILFDDSRRAVGVAYEHKGVRREAACRGEIILSAGAFQTPQILMLSGVGPADALRAHGIEAVADRRAVGENLHDHFGADIQLTSRAPVTLYNAMKPPGALKALFQMAFQGKGPYTYFPFDSGAMIRSGEDVDRPDLQFALGDYTREGGKKTMHRHGFNIAWCQSVPEARGRVRLAGPDPKTPPVVVHNFLGAEKDRIIQRRAFRIARALLQTDAFAPFVKEEISPGGACENDEEIDAYLAEAGGQHHHPVGTARMGADNEDVLDPELRVRGVERLRVADASIMPVIVSGNTNAPCIMIGERAADLILRDAR